MVGYFLNMSVMPPKKGTVDAMFIDKYTAKAKTAGILNAVGGGQQRESPFSPVHQ